MNVKGLEKIKTVVYARVSTDKQELDMQINQMLNFANAKNYDVSDVYAEIISGTKESRPEFDRLFNNAHKMKFQHLIFYDLSRFTRTSVPFTIWKLNELDNLGITWESYNQQFLSNMGQFKNVVIAIFAEINKAQADLTSEKTKLAYEINPQARKNWGKRGKDKKKRNRVGYIENYRNNPDHPFRKKGLEKTR